MTPPPPTRVLRRLALVSLLVAAAGFTRGVDTAVVVALSLAVMEIDANLSP